MWLRKVTSIFGECEPDTVNWFWSPLQAKSLLEKVSAWWDGVEMGRNPGPFNPSSPRVLVEANILLV